ncbi:hypothetical protein X797_011795 [Metarhizium robertsii]|uniref:Uncharacterized protein n=1 Tax=Metarhizium robertsii TaxID=568076 RepID=A0A014PHT9_9HYPO|nr:hypothetical protein X797_011795 [Metarhizium robertsii]
MLLRVRSAPGNATTTSEPVDMDRFISYGPKVRGTSGPNVFSFCGRAHDYWLRFLVLDAQLALLAERKCELFPVGVADIVARL